MLNGSHRKALSTVGCRWKLICRDTLPESKPAPQPSHKDLLFISQALRCMCDCVGKREMALEKRVFHPKLWGWWLSYIWDGAMLVGSWACSKAPAVSHAAQFAANRLVVLARSGLGMKVSTNILFIWEEQQDVTFVWKVNWQCLTVRTQCWLRAVSKICKSSTVCKSQRPLVSRKTEYIKWG